MNRYLGILAFVGIGVDFAGAAEPPAYAAEARKIAAQFKGTPGVVLHVGDSITYANPYSAWPRYGAGKTEADKALLKWMHTNAENERDGWHLARLDHPDGGRSETAASGIRADQLLEGGFAKLPAYEKLLAKYRPQIVVLLIGTNDASEGRTPKRYLADVAELVQLTHKQNAILVLTTIPPHPSKFKLAAEYNDGLRDLAASKKLPLIDFEKEILSRRPNDWNGTLLNKNDVHPTADVGPVTAASEPTEANLKTSGYLLRGWLTVRKLAEVKQHVLDELKK
jgi:lysophospholipase L1-like esterase